MAPTVRKVALGILATFALLVVGALIFLQTVNEETTKTKMEEGFRQQTGGILSIGELELSLPFSLTMRNVSISDPDRLTIIVLERLDARAVYWKLFTLRPTVRLTAVSGGDLGFDLSTNLFFSEARANIESHGFQLDTAFSKTGGNTFPVKAKLDGSADFLFPFASPTDVSGNASLTLNGLALTDTSGWGALFKSLIPESAACSLAAEGGEVSTTECAFATKMGRMELRATARLARQPGDSVLEGAFVLRPTGSLADTVSALYGKYRKPDGAFYFPLKGTLAAPGIDI